MNRRKRGFTLIEIIIVISLMSIILCFSYTSVKSFQLIKAKYENQYCENKILSFFNLSKEYCKNNKCDGVLKFDTKNNKIKFSVIFAEIDCLYFPEKFKLESTTISSFEGKLVINDKGQIENFGSFNYRDSYNTLHTVSLSVGTGYVEIK